MPVAFILPIAFLTIFIAKKDDKWQIIDGLQRIGTIKEFVVEEKFELTSLEFLSDLNGCRYQYIHLFLRTLLFRSRSFQYFRT